jgi:hypothetical protein
MTAVASRAPVTRSNSKRVVRTLRAELRVGLGAKKGALALGAPAVDANFAVVRDDPVAWNGDRNSIGEARLSDRKRIAGNAHPPGNF